MMRSFVLATCLTLGVSALVACTPKYPKCDRDEHCKPGEFCVDGQCQQCREDKDCPGGEVCNRGRCQAKAACKDDADCGPRGKCKDGRCVTAPCRTDGDCPSGQECRDGTCVAPPNPGETSRAPCTPPSIHFDFDEYVLNSEATDTLNQKALPCLKRVPEHKVRIEGHCDPRGTEEYNLALGDRRAQSVMTYLERIGIPGSRLHKVSKGKLEAGGTDERGWATDRRAQFFWE